MQRFSGRTAPAAPRGQQHRCFGTDGGRVRRPHHAAICSADCAKHNHLEILASRISNVVPNFTQFICITKDMQVAPEASVISVMLTLSNEPGSLSRILNKFFLYGLDMTKIESRPIRDAASTLCSTSTSRATCGIAASPLSSTTCARAAGNSSSWEMPLSWNNLA